MNHRIDKGDVMVKWEKSTETYYLITQTGADSIKIHEEDYKRFEDAVLVARAEAGKSGRVWDATLKNRAKWRIITA